MLSDARAVWLAGHAERAWLPGPGRVARRRRWRARWAAWILTIAGDRGDTAAVEAVWHAWLRRPDDARWELLSRWHSPQALADRVTDAMTDPSGDATARATLAGFCVRHRVLPGDPARRVLLFALTGQHEQRRAADPDGSLLAAAYRAAAPPVRAALREALADAGDLDVVRVVAGAGSQATDMTAEERQYLTGQLAGRRDWAGLWRLARDLPVADAVAAVHLIDERWQPDSQRDRGLFRLLAYAQPDVIGQARATLGGPIRIEVPGRVVAGALSADGGRLAVATAGRVRGELSVYDLPGGTLVRRCDIPSHDTAKLVYAGTTLILACTWRAGDPKAGTLLYRCPDRQSMAAVFQYDAATARLAARRRGFLTARSDGLLAFHDSTAWLIRTWGVRRVGLRWPDVILATDLDSGRLAVCTDDSMMVLDEREAASEPMAKRETFFRDDRCRGVCFDGPDRLITIGTSRTTKWSLDGTGFRPVASQPMGEVPPFGHCPVLVPARGEICVLTTAGTVTYLDVQALNPVREGRELANATGTVLFGSPGGACHALGGDGFVYLVTAGQMRLRALADRPQASWRLADLTAPLAAARPAARPLRDLLSACLEHRFGGEVALGRDDLSSADDDIAVSP